MSSISCIFNGPPVLSDYNVRYSLTQAARYTLSEAPCKLFLKRTGILSSARYTLTQADRHTLTEAPGTLLLRRTGTLLLKRTPTETARDDMKSYQPAAAGRLRLQILK